LAAIICLLRAVNVGGHAPIRMADLKATFESVGFSPVHTVLQSGNVVLGAKSAKLAEISATIARAIETDLKLRPDVILRTPSELRAIVKANPFPRETQKDPGHLLVQFLAGPADKSAKAKLEALAKAPEKFVIGEREVYIHYANGAGRSKLGGTAMDKALGTRGTARNWNTVLKLLGLAETIA
jgi:uncharacterized protein (DUF1697 family)